MKARVIKNRLTGHGVTGEEILAVRTGTAGLRAKGFKVIGGLDEPLTASSIDNYAALLHRTGKGYMILFDDVYSPFSDEFISFRHIDSTSEYITYMFEKGLFPECVKAIDIGCGSGIQALALIRKMADLSGTQRDTGRRVIIHAIDIQGSAVDNTLANIKMALPESRHETMEGPLKSYKIIFPGSSLYAGMEIIVAQVMENSAFGFPGALDNYDIITANLPNAEPGVKVAELQTQLPRGGSGLSAEESIRIINHRHADSAVIKTLLLQIAGRLSENGAASIGMLRDTLRGKDRFGDFVIPVGLALRDDLMPLVETGSQERIIRPFGAHRPSSAGAIRIKHLSDAISSAA